MRRSCYEAEQGISAYFFHVAPETGVQLLLQSRSQSYADRRLYSPTVFTSVPICPQELMQSLWEPLTAYKAVQVNER